MICRALAFWGVALGAAVAAGAEPHVEQLTPLGAQRGTEVEVVLSGARLADAKELLLYDPGITVKALEAGKPNQVKVRLALAADCAVGPHGLRLRTATGISNLHTFSVGTLPEINETEPNNTFETAQAIPLGVTVNGLIPPEDVDYFRVEAKKGQRLTAEVEGLRLGLDFFDPYVAILNAKRFVLAAADDTAAVYQDCVCSIIAPDDGTYFIQVRESAYGGSARSHYRLHVGSFPRPLAAYPPGGKTGQTLDVRWLGDVGGPWNQPIRLPDAPGEFRVPAQDSRGLSPWPLPLRVSKWDNVLEVEPNNDPAHATRFTPPAALNGVLAEKGDVDLFRFAAKKGQVFDVRVLARALRSPVDSVLSIQHANGAGVASNDDAGGPDSYLRFTAPADDEYLLTVADQLHGGGPEYVYRVEVTPVEPRLVLSLPERQNFVDMVAPVPRGNRTAFLVQVNREDFGGPIELEFKDLPPGITVDAQPIAEQDGMAAVVLSAAPNAEISGRLVDLIGRAKLNNQVLEGRLRQRTSLVRGQNDREVWNHYTERLATAVVDAVPYSLEITPPKAPLVQGGAMQLKVLAKRQPGFDGPITVAMLYFPGGVSSSSAITIAPGQTEGLLPLTTDRSARVGTFRISVLGFASADGGTLTVAAPFVNLNVSEPFFDFRFPTLTMDQGQSAELAVGIEKHKDFAGTVKVELLGLPGEVATQPKEFNRDAKEVVFPIQTSDKSPVGRHKTLLCRAVATVDGEPVTHMQGTCELRIQKPVPAKTPPAAAAQPAPAAPAPQPAAPAEKRLSRLEQLRQQKQGAAVPEPKR